jgi:hypothetical protein
MFTDGTSGSIQMVLDDALERAQFAGLTGWRCRAARRTAFGRRRATAGRAAKMVDLIDGSASWSR